MLYKALKKLKDRNGLTDDLKNKIDIFFATGRITKDQYNELMEIRRNRVNRRTNMKIRAEPQGSISLGKIAPAQPEKV